MENKVEALRAGGDDYVTKPFSLAEVVARVQKTNASGVATFKTIYPGFYQGRAVHIHVKVHVGGSVVHTGQLFFPASVTNVVYKRAPYSAHGTTPDTPNPSDSVFRNGGSKGILTLKKSRPGYVGTIGMGVHLT